MIAILHNIRSLHNVGSIFRTADAAGIEKIYLGGYTPSPLDQFGKVRPKFKKVSLGAEGYVPWQKVRSTVRIIKELKLSGSKIIAVEQTGSAIPYFAYRYSRDNLVFIVGNEVRGLPKSVLELSDQIVEIPMRGKKESLNVAVAFGIVAFHLTSSLK